MDHVFLVVLENTSYKDVIGSSAMSFLNGLATQYGLAADYYADTHPSIGNYFMLTTGQTISLDDKFSGTVSDDNVAREIVAAGKTWKVYAESLPKTGYMGWDVYPYIKHHNPFVYFSDVLKSTAEQQNIVSSGHIATDMQADTLPNYGFIVPDNQHNAHDCPVGMSSCTLGDKLQAADDWLRDNVGPLIADSAFHNSGLLVIVFDEASSADTTNGGGHVAAVVVGSAVKAGWHSTTLYQHENTLRLTMDALGITTAPGKGATAAQMTDFFQ